MEYFNYTSTDYLNNNKEHLFIDSHSFNIAHLKYR